MYLTRTFSLSYLLIRNIYRETMYRERHLFLQIWNRPNYENYHFHQSDNFGDYGHCIVHSEKCSRCRLLRYAYQYRKERERASERRRRHWDEIVRQWKVVEPSNVRATGEIPEYFTRLVFYANFRIQLGWLSILVGAWLVFFWTEPVLRLIYHRAESTWRSRWVWSCSSHWIFSSRAEILIKLCFLVSRVLD